MCPLINSSPLLSEFSISLVREMYLSFSPIDGLKDSELGKKLNDCILLDV